MAQHYEPARILPSLNIGIESENMQQYVEIGNNTFLGIKDGIKYALVESSDNKFKLCEIPSDSSSSSSSSLKSSWYSPFEDECRNDLSTTAAVNGYRSLKLMTTLTKESPCKGQGDESGNSIISTPDSSSAYRNMNVGIPEQISNSMEKSRFDENQPMTYATLLPKHEIIQNENLLTYSIPQENHFFAAPQAQITPLTSKPGRFLRNRQRTQLMPHASTPYPTAPQLLSTSNRGRQRRTRPMFYQYRAQDLHSTPNSGIQIPDVSSILSSSTKDSSGSSCNESLEYPRVPNNTPSSGSEVVGKQKVLDLQQWIPQLQSRMEGFSPIDPRESHNEKERKRRLRIKNACQSMKNLLPCICDKTDNATVFENAVHFIAFMRETIGTQYDMEFLEQTCVY